MKSYMRIMNVFIGKLKDSDKIVNKKIVQDCNFSSG